MIVGVIDSGVDWRHDSFRGPTGGSRIVRIWDQNLAAQAGESAPAAFGYGVEYTQTAINAALTAPDPLDVVRHMDDSVGHGTHVCGIAAGDGSVAGDGSPAFTFIGMAPEADLAVVANRVTTDGARRLRQHPGRGALPVRRGHRARPTGGDQPEPG